MRPAKEGGGRAGKGAHGWLPELGIVESWAAWLGPVDWWGAERRVEGWSLRVRGAPPRWELTTAAAPHSLPTRSPHPRPAPSAVDDLVRSDFLHEPGILHTLQVRYALGEWNPMSW